MSKIKKKPKDCVCKKSLIFWEEDNKYTANPIWNEIEFKANEIYCYRRSYIKSANYTNFKLYKKDEEGMILKEEYTLSEESFNKHFVDIGLFRENRINEILDENTENGI